MPFRSPTAHPCRAWLLLSAGRSGGRAELDLAQGRHPDRLRREPAAHGDAAGQRCVELDADRADRQGRARRRRPLVEPERHDGEDLAAVVRRVGQRLAVEGEIGERDLHRALMRLRLVPGDERRLVFEPGSAAKPACGAWAWAGDRAEPETAMARAMVQNLMVWPPVVLSGTNAGKMGTGRYQSSGFFNDEGSDPLLDHHEPGLARHRRQPAA